MSLTKYTSHIAFTVINDYDAIQFFISILCDARYTKIILIELRMKKTIKKRKEHEVQF